MAPDDPGLFPVAATAPGTDGRHADALKRAITAATDAEQLTAADEAAASLALAAMAALDRAEAMPAHKSVYPVAQLIAPAREVLETLRLTPASRQSVMDDALATLMEGLTAHGDATPSHTPQA